MSEALARLAGEEHYREQDTDDRRRQDPPEAVEECGDDEKDSSGWGNLLHALSDIGERKVITSRTQRKHSANQYD